MNQGASTSQSFFESTQHHTPIVSRNCAFCLITLPLDKVKYCGSCLRRAYCSRDCQMNDWEANFPTDTTKQRGQGHKNWCSLNVGEEDLDWKVVPIAGKGVGVVALRDFEPGTRIMVDACQLSGEAHPQAKHLVGNTMEEIMNMNCLGCDVEDDVRVVLPVRIARINHNCVPNAGHWYDNTFKVKVIFAVRKIRNGEEICITYAPFDDVSNSDSPSIIRLRLQESWNIKCEPTCGCYNEQVWNQIEKARQIDRFIETSDPRDTVGIKCILEHVNKLLAIQQKLQMSQINIQRTLFNGLMMAQRSPLFIPQGYSYAKASHEIVSSILHPSSKLSLRAERLKNQYCIRN